MSETKSENYSSKYSPRNTFTSSCDLSLNLVGVEYGREDAKFVITAYRFSFNRN